MNAIHSSAAAWVAPLFSHINAHTNIVGKLTHKLQPMACVLWLPDYGAYLRSVDLLRATFTTSPNAEGAMRLGDDQAATVAQDLIEVTGVRVHLRQYVGQH